MTKRGRRLPTVVLSTTAASLVLFGSVAIAGGGDSGNEPTQETVTSGSFEVATQPPSTSAVTTTAVPDDEPVNVPGAPQPETATDPANGGDPGIDVTTRVALDPLRVRIPGIQVDAPIIDLGLNPDGTLEVPSDFDDTGWYTGRSIPGEVGPSVVVGHVDSTKGPAVFYRLRELEVGDRVQIERTDGSVALFEVTDTVLVDKDEFPTEEVYGATDAPTLRLITCGGSFDRDERSYRGNVIVYAEHVGNYEPVATSGVN